MERRLVASGDLRRKLRGLMLAIIAAILSIISVIAIYLIWGYYQIEKSFTAKEQLLVQVNLDAGSVSEIGYICDFRNVTCIKNKTKRLYWWVKSPNTKKRYLCEWNYGFSGFQKNDAVVFIHQADGAEWPADLTGYLIGRQGKIKDKPACVTMHGVDQSD